MAPRGTQVSIASIGIAFLILVGAAVWFGLGATSAPPQAGVENDRPDASSVVVDTIVVHISGAVVRPGVVVVPSEARIADVVLAAGGATRVADLGTVNLAATVRDGEHVAIPSVAPGGQAGVSAIDSPFDLNAASVEDLEELPGVGPVLAKRIADHRETYGPFDTVEDLLDVPGIGESKLAAIRDFIESA